jgi:cobalamin biosynthesis protein CobT
VKTIKKEVESSPHATQMLAEKGRHYANQLCDRLKLPVFDEAILSPGFKQGVLDDLNLYRVGHESSPRCFSQLEIAEIPKFFCGLLIDCSGSMYGHRIEQAKQVGAALALALDDNPYVMPSVAGHDANKTKIALEIAKQPTSKLDLGLISTLKSRAENLDAYALIAYAKYLHGFMEDYDKGLIILICDGAPCHSYKAMKNAINLARVKYKLELFAIGLGITEELCREMYGENNWVTVEELPNAMPAIATKFNQLIEKLNF